MVQRPGFLLIPAALVASFLLPGSGSCQISFPGQYPGQYPGQNPYPGQSPYPGQGRYPGGGGVGGGGYPGQTQSRTETTREQKITVITLTGMLRRISDTDMVVEADDKRIVTVALATSTKYYKGSGDNARNRDLVPGDHLSVDATQDDNGYYHAKAVTQVRKGTVEDRAAAAQPVDTSPLADSGKGGGTVDGDDDRPRLKRSSSSADDSSRSAITPQITRGDPSDAPASSRSQTAQNDPPAAPDPDDPGAPKLRRGVPQPRAASTSRDSDPPLVAQNDPPAGRPSIHAQEVNGVTQKPNAPKIDTGDSGGRGSSSVYIPKSGDPIIDNAREAAFSFAETLPNYVVKQFTTRYATEAARGGQTSWRAIDTVTADVVSDGGKETYKNILVNGKAPKEAVEKSGSWSTGEYSSVLLDILSPGTDADFHNKRTTTIVNRSAYRYDFSVDQTNSHWKVYSSSESYNPQYTGAIWIDKDNSRVLRIELSARNMPRAFALDTVESAVDYDYVLIGDSKFLLPVHSEALSCERGTSDCSRNVIDFRNYKKFGADTSITFDSSPDK